MEPGHVGRVEIGLSMKGVTESLPQWSPATWAGWR